MKKIIQIICCALGSVMIGFFAKELDSTLGIVLFSVGVFMLVFSSVAINKNESGNK